MHYGIPLTIHRNTVSAKMQETTIKSNPSLSKLDTARAAADTLEILGAAEATADAAELAPFSGRAVGEDLGTRFAPSVVIKKP